MKNDQNGTEATTNNVKKRVWGVAALSGGLMLAIAFALVGSAGARNARVTAAPVNTAPPTISGTAQEGQTLTTTNGTWTGTGTITYAYQWQRCNATGGGCGNEGGQTHPTFVVQNPDVGSTIRVVVTATDAGGPTSATSVPTAVVSAVTAKPVNTAPPTISGTVQEGQTLTSTTGTWTGAGTISYGYQWQRCNATGGGCGNEGGQTHPTFVVQNADVGSTVRVVVTAQNSGGTTTSTSVPTAVVKAAAVAPPTGCTTSGGTVAIAGITSPARLNIDQFQINPSTITYNTRTLTVRFHVSACGGSVQGALIYLTAVPYAMFAPANEQTTGADGWATLNLTALSGFPVSKHQQLLVMFVRARKPGEDILAGISSRRLVSFRVTHG